MTPASSISKSSTTQRLRSTAPALYDAVAPIVHAVARSIALARQSREAARLSSALRTGGVRWVKAPDSPRVLFDGCAFQDAHSGIARLWCAVLAEWSASGFARHVVVLDRAGTAPRHPGFTYLPAPPLRAHDAVSTRSMLEVACDETGADVFVSSSYTTPETFRSLLYVYDMTPEVLGWDVGAPLWRDKHRAIDQASAYVCLSQNTEEDLRRICPQAENRPSRAVLPGVDGSFVPASTEAVDRLIGLLDLPATYFIFLGHRDNYKNANLVFDAVEGLSSDDGWGLLLIGGRPELEARFGDKVAHVAVRIASLSDEELRAAYSGAAALLYVSRYEGFGLPILEAMACDCPVITCSNSSLPEAAGNAALFVDEDDPSGLRQAMFSVTDPALRADLVARGRAWSARFSWAHSAAGIEAAIRDLAR